ncbi:feather keratin 2-like [Dryobates pubescens]|uniref:feather keratin 2-like n=1 Tax=Dryobates pubescens TaxID=118200 RepID=UPI0023B909A8|nr:feather keratin 2-like [Dryobates pubescens]
MRLWPLHPTPMACYDRCRPCGPNPLANSCNEPLRPILTSFPQSQPPSESSSGLPWAHELNAPGQAPSPPAPSATATVYGLAGLGYGCGAVRGCYPAEGPAHPP